MPFDPNAVRNAKRGLGFFTVGKFALLVVLLVVFFGGCSTFHKIGPGHVGIIYNNFGGGLEDRTLNQGGNWVAPWKSITEYPISTEIAYFNASATEGRKSDDSITIGTKDGKTMKVDMQIAYHMSQEKLPHVFNKFKGAENRSIEYGYMRQNVQRLANDISSQYSMLDIVGEKKAEFNSKVYAACEKFFDEDGIIIEQAGLGKVEPDEATKQAIQAVANAQYAQKQADYEKLAATANAQTVIEKAKGEAKAKEINADAEAYRMQKLAQATDDRIVNLEWVKKWDGKLPVTILGGSQGMMLNMNMQK